MRNPRLLLSCEHGGNDVPAAYRKCLSGSKRLLRTHRGHDLGAREAARELQRRLRAPLVCATVTRLLVDLNRSPGHPQLFSSFTRGLAPTERRQLLERHYYPYRDLVAGWIEAAAGAGAPVLHLSVHSFTPVLDGVRRRAELGLLYDPSRAAEASLCREWQRQLIDAGWRVRHNYPYRGTSDGLVSALRRRFGAQRYIGIELEFNQACLGDPVSRRALLGSLAAAILAR